MAMIKVSAGRVPGGVKELTVEEGQTVEQVMQIAARECNFTFSTKAYEVGSKVMLDVPSIGGKELCRRDKNVIVEVFWQTIVTNGAVILLVPKIKGN